MFATKSRRTASSRRRSDTSSMMPSAPTVRRSSSRGEAVTTSVRRGGPKRSSVRVSPSPSRAVRNISSMAAPTSASPCRADENVVAAWFRNVTSPLSSQMITPCGIVSSACAIRPTATSASPRASTAPSTARSRRARVLSRKRGSVAGDESSRRNDKFATRRTTPCRARHTKKAMPMSTITAATATATAAPSDRRMTTPNIKALTFSRGGRLSTNLGDEMVGIAREQVPQSGTDDGHVIVDALERSARSEGGDGRARRVDTGETEQFLEEPLVEHVHLWSGPGKLCGEIEIHRRPRPQAVAIPVDDHVGHGAEDLVRRRVGGDGLVIGRGLDDAQREVADAFELRQDPKDRHDETQIGRDRRFSGQEVVAALGERHIHRVDVVVGAERHRHEAHVASLEHLAHALEVLVDANGHQLDL